MDEIEKFLDELDLNDLVRPALKHPDPKIPRVDVTCPKIPFYLKLSVWGDVFVNYWNLQKMPI